MLVRLVIAPWILAILGTVTSYSIAGETRDVAGNFQVSFPGDTRVDRREIKMHAVADALKGRSFSVQTDEGQAFVLTYVDYPQEVVQEIGPEGLLANVQSIAVSNLGGTRTAVIDFRPSDHVGRQIAFHGKVRDIEYTGQLRLLLVEQRLYQLLVWGRKDKFRSTQAKEFFSSFELLRSD